MNSVLQMPHRRGGVPGLIKTGPLAGNLRAACEYPSGPVIHRLGTACGAPPGQTGGRPEIKRIKTTTTAITSST